MENSDLNAGENERPIASYPYRDKSERNAQIVLTPSSLVFSCHPYKDVFPLKELKTISVESGRNIGVIIALAIGLVLSLGCAVIFGNTIFLQTANAPVFMKTVPVGMLLIGLFLLVVLIRFRFRFVRIVVTRQSGVMQYEVPALNQPLLDFVGTVQQAVSTNKK